MSGSEIPGSEELLKDLERIGREELEALKDALTPERRRRFHRGLTQAGKLAVEAAHGKDVSRKARILKSVLLDYGAIAALVLGRSMERASARGLEAAGRFLGALARGIAAGALA